MAAEAPSRSGVFWRSDMADLDKTAYDVLAEKLVGRGVDLEKVKQRLKSQHIETPSCGFADSGTRF